MSNNKCSKCKILPTHHKCTICKLVLICPECYDKREISNLNSMAYKVCQTKEAGITLAQLSDSITLTVNSESIEVKEVYDNLDLNLSLVT